MILLLGTCYFCDINTRKVKTEYMNPLKKLMGETVIYGFTTIIGRFINWLLVPLYTRVLLPDEYGVIVHLMAYTSILMVLLTYGTETGFFRFATKEGRNKVFSTLLTSLTFTSLVFVIFCFSFLPQISNLLEVPDYPIYIALLAVTVAIDVLTSLPFALLRLDSRPIRFGIIKLVNIGINVGSNLFFLLLCPFLEKKGIHVLFYNPEGGVIYVFISYLIASVITLIMLLPYILKFKFVFSFSLLKDILKYSYPILIVSLAGIINLQGDKILMPLLLEDKETSMAMTGIYGASYKLALVMYIFTQGFRFAFEPFFFNYSRNSDSKKIYEDVLLYFTGFGLMIFLGVMFNLDILKYFVKSNFFEGLPIVPWVLMANLFQGMYYSLSLWYKLTDKTIYGAYMAIIGCVITVVGNVVFLPRIGFMASAYSVFTCFLVMTILSFILGRHFYKINYDIPKIIFYFVICLVFYFVGRMITFDSNLVTCLARLPLFVLFVYIFVRREMSFLLTKDFMYKLIHKK